jgi:hypothetical protein
MNTGSSLYFEGRCARVPGSRLGKYPDRDEKLATSAPAFPAFAHCCPGFCGGLGSLENQAGLRVGRMQARGFGRRGVVPAPAERAKEAAFEAGKQERVAVCERAGGGLMQDAQPHEGDQCQVDLRAPGVFAAAEKAADFEVLLEPFEQQLDLPALFLDLAAISAAGRLKSLVSR